MSKPARRLRISVLSCLLAAWPLYAGTQPPAAAAPERLAVSRTLPADPSQDSLHRWFAEQDKILDDILTRLARIETLVTDIHRLISKLPSPAPAAVAPAPVAPVSVPAAPAVVPPGEPAKRTETPAPPPPAPEPAEPKPDGTKPTAAPAAAPPAKPAAPAQPDEFDDEGFVIADWMPQLAGAGALLLLLLLWLRRRTPAKKPVAGKAAAPSAPAAKMPAPAAPSVPEAAPLPAKQESRQPAAAPAQKAFVDTASVDLDLGTDSDQSDQALELAEIMLSMGLGQGAAQTLTEQIRNEPKQALRHWLKLLEVYRRNGQQAEFERSAEELRLHFNVKPEDWHARPGSQHSVEDYPHIAARLTELWAKPACLVYLKNLLADNRGGARSGFPQSVAEELLLLTAILRSEGFLS